MKELILSLTLCLALSAGAQTSTVTALTTNTPRTTFDLYKATPDALLVEGFSTIGTLDNQISYPVEIRVARLTNLQTTNSVYAVELKTRIGQLSQVDYIDYDELDNLIRSVPLISQATTSITPFDSSEMLFHTRSGLSLAKVAKTTKSVVIMTSGDINGVRNQMAAFVLDDFGRYLTAAKAKIDAIAASGQ
jgi:hypothetical protein